MTCSRYRVPHPCLQPFFWLSVLSLWVDTWATTIAEVRKPSGSPLLRSPLLTEHAKTLSLTCRPLPTRHDATYWLKCGRDQLSREE